MNWKDNYFQAIFNKAEQNLYEGKRVIFVQNENEPVNADGLRGYLKVAGVVEYTPGIYESFFKRGIDFMISLTAMLLLMPLFILISAAIVIDDPGPLLFTQLRVGKGKKYFHMHKFRSMKMCTPRDIPTHMLEDPEQYITNVGKFLRKHSLDELPQLWDILIGNMSIIGPRPALWNQDVLVAERDCYAANEVRPGLTGWAQINGRDQLPISIKAQMDGYYVKKLGPVMDARIFFRSIHVLKEDSSIVEGRQEERSKMKNDSEAEKIGHIGFGEPVFVDTAVVRKVLITGADSYIGESFRKYAAHRYQNLQIDAVDTHRDWENADFSSYDIVFHVAGIAHADSGKVSEERITQYYKVNRDLAVEICRKAKKEGVREFIFMSSMIVYGDSVPFNKHMVIDKNTVPAPSSYYGDGKFQADMTVRKMADEQFKVIVLRPPMIYGENCKGNYPILSRIAKKTKVFPYIENQRSMLYIDNLCEFLCQVMQIRSFSKNSVVLIPQNEQYTITSDMVKKIADVNSRTLYMPGGLMKGVVWIGTKVPGKIGSTVNKAFGNFAYDQSLSEYEGIQYRVIDFAQSIKKSEGKTVKKKYDYAVDATAIIMTKNEAKNIGDCLDSMRGFARRCVVIDCGSTDETIAIAKQKGADVYFHEFEYYAKQFNWGINNCDIDTEWIIRLDADERFPQKLKKELAEIIHNDKKGNINGITIEADYYFLGKCMTHGLTNKRKMMMFKKSCGRIEDKRRDAHSVITEGINVDAKCKFIHYDFKNLDSYIRRYNWYATREMQDYLEYVSQAKGASYHGDEAIRKQREKKYEVYYKAPMFLRAFLWFLYNYFLKKGFLDGKEGLMFLFFECCWYRMLVDAKIYEQMKTGAEFEALKALD